MHYGRKSVVAGSMSACPARSEPDGELFRRDGGGAKRHASYRLMYWVLRSLPQRTSSHQAELATNRSTSAVQG